MRFQFCWSCGDSEVVIDPGGVVDAAVVPAELCLLDNLRDDGGGADALELRAEDTCDKASGEPEQFPIFEKSVDIRCIDFL